MQNQNLPKKDVELSSLRTKHHLAVNSPSRQNSNEQQLLHTFCQSTSLKAETPHQLCQEVKHLGLQQQYRESSSTQSIGESHHAVGATRGTSTQDQCISSESGQEESCNKSCGGQLKPSFYSSNPDFVLNPSQVDYNNYSMACVPYPFSDPYFGVWTSHGPQTVIQPQMGGHLVGLAPSRVPLPLDLADDGPIYVNAKQYHGILRRRQSRAKLEAQNKVIKARKPYLHESRHIHALKRVRGSGGRFISAKKAQQTHPTPTASSEVTNVSHSSVTYRHPRMVGAVQCNEVLMCSGTQHCPSVVR